MSFTTISKIKIFFIVVIAFSFLLFSASYKYVFAQDSTPDNEFTKAEVTEIVDEGTRAIEGFDGQYANPYQKVKVKIIEGADLDKVFTIDYSGMSVTAFQKVKVGQLVVLNKVETADGTFQYQIIDKLRTNELAIIAFLFLFLVILLSRWKGVGSILGMLFSLAVILKFIIPQILAGKDPLTISILGAIAIMITSIYLAHGFTKQTTIAVIATALTLVITGFLSVAFVNLTNLSGISNEDTSSLLFGGPTATINFKGLLLGGMIIGFLGVLDDITTGMAATVFELKKVNPKLKFNELIKSSLNVGIEHVSSLVNTLVLAYAGASLPIFLYLVLNPQGYPVWFMVNSEFIAEEIVRTLVGSIGLLFAVPITTVIAVYYVSKKKE
ncbi:MAG: YibE/F family protein [Candidatus Paceibacterota bacterium]|jgi:uncharacterized membrane protein